MGNPVNWLLVILGIICVIAELALGVMTGFDLALIGASLIASGIVGLVFGSGNVGLLSTAILAFLYFALFRRWLKAKLPSLRCSARSASLRYLFPVCAKIEFP